MSFYDIDMRTSRRIAHPKLPPGLTNLGAEDVQVLKRIAQAGAWERQLRLACLGIMGAAVWVLTGLWLQLVWLPAYFGLLEVNARLTARLPDQVTGWRVAGLAAALLADSLLYFAMVVYLAGQPGFLFKALALFMLAGYMLNATTDHCESSLLVAVDIVAVGLALAILPLAAAGELDDTRVSVLVAGAAMLWLYFSLSVVSTMRARQRLRASVNALTETKIVETIGRLTGGLARDFGGHMTVILGNLELALATDDDRTRTARMREAHQAACDAAGLTSQLVAFAGRAHLRPVALDLVTFLEEVRPRLRRLLPAGVTLEVQAHSVARMVHVDRRQLETVLAELVENARDAMAASGAIRLITGDVELTDPLDRAGRTPLPAGRYLRLSVQDNGSGIPERLIGQVQEPFFTTKGGSSAHGLGLSMAKGFAEQSGGALVIESTPGQGTEIAMLFPVHVHSRF